MATPLGLRGPARRPWADNSVGPDRIGDLGLGGEGCECQGSEGFGWAPSLSHYRAAWARPNLGAGLSNRVWGGRGRCHAALAGKPVQAPNLKDFPMSSTRETIHVQGSAPQGMEGDKEILCLLMCWGPFR